MFVIIIGVFWPKETLSWLTVKSEVQLIQAMSGVFNLFQPRGLLDQERNRAGNPRWKQKNEKNVAFQDEPTVWNLFYTRSFPDISYFDEKTILGDLALQSTSHREVVKTDVLLVDIIS